MATNLQVSRFEKIWRGVQLKIVRATSNLHLAPLEQGAPRLPPSDDHLARVLDRRVPGKPCGLELGRNAWRNDPDELTTRPENVTMDSSREPWGPPLELPGNTGGA